MISIPPSYSTRKLKGSYSPTKSYPKKKGTRIINIVFDYRDDQGNLKHGHVTGMHVKTTEEVPTSTEVRKALNSKGYRNVMPKGWAVVDKPYRVDMEGGSIGKKSGHGVAYFATREEAKEFAKHRNAMLSAGEKSYYHIKYVVREE